jgi:preprotein translocase subunit SecG
MYTFLEILIVIAAILMILIVVIQESKGGGLASGFSASNQIMGVRKTTDIIEKLTWTLAALMVVFAVAISHVLPGASSSDSIMMQSVEQNATNPNNIPGFAASSAEEGAADKQSTPAAAEQSAAPASEPAAPDENN